jgi:hypothetical protein
MDRKGQFLGNVRQRGRQYVQQSIPGLQGRAAINSVFLLTLAVHIVDAWTGFQRGGNIFGVFFWVWFFTGIATWRMLSQGQGLNWPGLGQTMILSMIAYVLPIFIGVLEIALPHALANGLIVFAPVWVIYLFFTGQLQGFWRTACIVYMIIWMALAINFLRQSELLMYEIEDRFIYVKEPLTATWDMVKETSVDAKEGFLAFLHKYNQSKVDYLAYATGQDLYTAEVDEHAKEKLGVFFENVEKSQKDYIRDDSVSVWATIVARTFDEPMVINFNCIADRGKDSEVRPDRMIPSQPYVVEVQDDRDLDCSFGRRVFKPGSHRAHLYANFTFQTMAYKKTYFVDRSRANALAREDIDIMEYYGVDDEDPKAVYTSGPVMIGIDIRSAPMKIDRSSNDPTIVTLGVSLKNDWEGRIVNVTEFELILPPFAELEKMECGSNWTFTQAEPGRYLLTRTFGPIKMWQSLRCPIVIQPGYYDDVLGGTPIATHSFKATARYVYELEDTVSILVKNTKADEDWIKHTRTSKPDFRLDNFQLAKYDQHAFDLYDFAEDNETLDRDLIFKIKSQKDPVVAECVMQDQHFLVCTAGGYDGVTIITVEVDDMAHKVEECFAIAVGSVTLPSNEETDETCNGYHSAKRVKEREGGSGTSGAIKCLGPDPCDGTMSKAYYPSASAQNKECIELCEWYDRCNNWEGDWSCSCSETECDNRPADSPCKGPVDSRGNLYCEIGDMRCCTFNAPTVNPCCDDCSCTGPTACDSCQSCYYDYDIYYCRSNAESPIP